MILNRRPDIERFLAKPDAGFCAALIYGRDLGVVRERASQLAGKIVVSPVDPFDVALLNDGDLDSDGGRLETELSAQSLMRGNRLIRLRFMTEKVALERAVSETLSRHTSGALNPDAFFLIEAGALGRDSTLKKVAEKDPRVATIPCYEDEPGDVARMVREALSGDGVSLTQEGLAMFVARLPKERGVARQEIERLALYLQPGSGASAGPKDLEAFLGVEPEASLAEAAADAFGGRMAETQAGLRRAAGEGEAGAAAVRAISSYLGRLRKTLTLAKSGAGLQEAAKASGVFWKSEREFLRQARAWSLADLDQLQGEVLSADKACKTTGSPDQLIAERLSLQIAGRARRLGL